MEKPHASADHSTIRDIPHGYGDNRIVLMARDPWTLFSYWEVAKKVEDEVKRKINENGETPDKSLLRVYDVTGCASDAEYEVLFDFELRDWANNWYIHAGRPGREWMADIGILSSSGRFYTLARSNVVKSPVYGMSGEYDEEWMCPEDLYYKMFAFDVGKSSMEMKEILNRHLRGWFFSGGISSGMFGSGELFTHKR